VGTLLHHQLGNYFKCLKVFLSQSVQIIIYYNLKNNQQLIYDKPFICVYLDSKTSGLMPAVFRAATEHVTFITGLNPHISTEPLSSAAASTVVLFSVLKLVQLN